MDVSKLMKAFTVYSRTNSADTDEQVRYACVRVVMFDAICLVHINQLGFDGAAGNLRVYHA